MLFSSSSSCLFSSLLLSFVLSSVLSWNYCYGYAWSGLLDPDTAIDWSNPGVGDIPTRPSQCATLSPSATLDEINAALAACTQGQAVFLSAGVYNISGSIVIPSSVTLRGAGASLTILNATGGRAKQKGVIVLGSISNAGPVWKPVLNNITLESSTKGSSTLVLNHTTGITVGMFLIVTETNNASYVTIQGNEGPCTWCSEYNGSLARGQEVQITKVYSDGRTVDIWPALYSTFSNYPTAISFYESGEWVGVEDLQVYANYVGYNSNFYASACSYCWIQRVTSNYADGDHVQIVNGFHNEVRDSYFSNAFHHTSGQWDSNICLKYKTSATLVENNIIERTHVSVMLEWGAAGNVIAYNLMIGEYDSRSYVVIGGVNWHGAHPQFNLVEGNVMTKFNPDSIHGSSSQSTAFRNWIAGTTKVCSPVEKERVYVNCTNAVYSFTGARAVELSCETLRNNFVGNVLGSAAMQSLVPTWSTKPLQQIPEVEYPEFRGFTIAYGWTFGYGTESDNGNGTGCGSNGVPPCHLPGNREAQFFHGNYNNINGTITWEEGVTHTLPDSFYLSEKPAWWNAVPFPAIGPDVSDSDVVSGHSYGNPAMHCYFNVMGAVEGGEGSPYAFYPDTCYYSYSIDYTIRESIITTYLILLCMILSTAV